MELSERFKIRITVKVDCMEISNLKKLGFTIDCPAETIVTTFSVNGKPHASPMGTWLKKSGEIELRIHTSSRTFQNIVRTRAAVINISRDPKLLASQALKDVFKSKTSLKFKKSKFVDAPKLSNADAWIELEIKNLDKMKISDEIGTSEIARVVGMVRNIEVSKPSIYPLRRASFFLLESAILATKAIEAFKRGKDDVAEKIIQEIENYRERCRKVACCSSEMKMIEKIVNFLKKRRF
jgi:hypothetical protein